MPLVCIQFFFHICNATIEKVHKVGKTHFELQAKKKMKTLLFNCEIENAIKSRK